MAEYNMGPFKPNPKGVFKPNTKYRYFDLVEYNGGSYLNINKDDVDGTSSIGVLPYGQAESELYWMCMSKPGKDGTVAKEYSPFAVVEDDGIWDYSITDKVIVPNTVKELKIKGLYSGCIGMVISNSNSFKLPQNSDTSLDYNFVTAEGKQYYMYTFTCVDMNNTLRLIWNRTVINIDGGNNVVDESPTHTNGGLTPPNTP